MCVQNNFYKYTFTFIVQTSAVILYDWNNFSIQMFNYKLLVLPSTCIIVIIHKLIRWSSIEIIVTGQISQLIKVCSMHKQSLRTNPTTSERH